VSVLELCSDGIWNTDAVYGRDGLPLNITGLLSDTVPTKPVSSFNSLTAACSAVSPASMRPAGTSMTILSMGGRNCFCRRISGPGPQVG
jgi:hypothetical protein